MAQQRALRMFDAIVVLGCPVRLDASGRLCQRSALARRLDAAALAYAQRGGERTIVVASGGHHWGGLVEADVMARELARRNVPARAIVRERCSLTTRDNARFAAETLTRRGINAAAVVSCEWHLPRALALFRRAGVRADGVVAREYGTPWPKRFWRRGLERLLRWVQTR
ncbi:MAG TPA: YdcF family protein [Polyangiaceae bacterium]|nr:YdcF family protein [Polyangiaceae bacterium]